MNTPKLEELKRAYAELIVEGMDMKLLIEFAEDSIMDKIKGYEFDDIKEEIEDYYGKEVWDDLMAT